MNGQGRPHPYRLACCDCSLVHEMEFRVVTLRGRQRVLFRVRRNNRSTAAMRREKKRAKGTR